MRLIVEADISESKMSRDLGFNRGYIRSITSGRSFPQIGALMRICEYLNITMSEFFESDEEESRAIQRTTEQFNNLSASSKLALSSIIKKLE